MSEAEIQLSPAARSVVVALAEVDTITVVALASATGAGKSTVAKALTVLERAGFAHRTVRETDGVREADWWSPTAALGEFLSSAAGEANESDASSPSADDDAAAIEKEAGRQVSTAVADGSGVASTEAQMEEASARLAPGGLAKLVAEALAEHPGIDYSPTMLSHLLNGRSAGAIHNALEKMVALGEATRISDKPKRYRWAAPSSSVR